MKNKFPELHIFKGNSGWEVRAKTDTANQPAFHFLSDWDNVINKLDEIQKEWSKSE